MSIISCRVTPLLLEPLQVLYQVADREIGWIALAIVAKFFSQLEGGEIGRGEPLATVPAVLEDGANERLVLPGETAEQNGDAATSAVNGRSIGRRKCCGSTNPARPRKRIRSARRRC